MHTFCVIVTDTISSENIQLITKHLVQTKEYYIKVLKQVNIIKQTGAAPVPHYPHSEWDSQI